jgi:cellulose synthase/poly-beta-1,6-N-acetylglucosamine synthase-like glycosyltransferase
MIAQVLIVLGAVSAVWYCIAVLILRRGLVLLRPAAAEANETFSIVIAARNEEQTIGPCLDSVFAQSIDRSRYDVIVVNDRSTDRTSSILDEYARRFPQLRVITIRETPPGVSPKKYAVAQGVAVSENAVIVFTDADCRVPPAWLETIDRYFTRKTGLVQGITSYRYRDGMGRLFYRLQTLDFLSHGIVAAAAIGAGLPINSNANNFAFRKSAYLEAGGLTERIGHVVSGDDDLLLQKIWRSGTWKVAFMAEEKAAVQTEPTLTAGALFQQRARWGSKTVHYNQRQVLLLSGIFLFYCVILAHLFFSPFFPQLFAGAALLLVLKFAGECLLMVPGLRIFGHKELMYLLPVASLLQLPLVIAAVLSGVFGKFTWKEQSFSRTMR